MTPLWTLATAALAAAGSGGHGGSEANEQRTPLFIADVPAAVLASREGSAARARIEQAVRRAEADAQARRDRLLARRGGLSDAEFEAARAALNERVAAEERRLAALEAKLAGPIGERADGVLARLEAAVGAKISDVNPRRIAGLSAACDLTNELVRALDAPGASVDVKQDRKKACTPDLVARVDLARAVQGTPPAADIIEARDAYRARMAGQLAKLGASASDALRAQAIQREVAVRDDAARTALEDVVLRALTALAARYPSTVWWAASASPPEGAPVCDGTAWVRRALGATDSTRGDCRLNPP